MHIIRYLLRFGTMHEEKLVVKALQEQQITGNSKDWLNVSKTYLDNLGMSELCSNLPEKDRKIGEIKRISKCSRDREREIFQEMFFKELDSKREK